MKKILVLTMLLLLAVGLFASQKLDKLVSVEVKDSIIVATYTIPDSMHMFLQEDFFYLDVDEMENVVFEKTVYPEGHAGEDGLISFEGTVQLTKKFTLEEGVKAEDVNFKLYIGYQMCYDSYCEPPVDLETSLPLKVANVVPEIVTPTPVAPTPVTPETEK